MEVINRVIDTMCGTQFQRHQIDRTGSSSSSNEQFTERDDSDISKGQSSNYEYEQMQKKKLEEYSFGSQFAVSCFTIIFCGVIFGVVAMILSVCANRSALYYNKLEEARRLGFASYVVSIIGIALGTAVVAALIMWSAYELNNGTFNPNCWASYEVYTC